LSYIVLSKVKEFFIVFVNHFYRGSNGILQFTKSVREWMGIFEGKVFLFK